MITPTTRAQANPQPHQPLTDADVPAHRRTDCARLSSCLDICLSAGWPSFSCAQCPVREPTRGTLSAPDSGARLVGQ